MHLDDAAKERIDYNRHIKVQGCKTRIGYKCRENEKQKTQFETFFGGFYFVLATENFVSGVFVFCGLAISFAMGGLNRKLQNHKKRKHQKQNFR